MIPEQTIQQVIDTARIEEVVGEVVHLKKRGVNFIGNCPFHDERTPSFTVSPVKGIYKCFGCGAAGNVVRFVMEHDQLTYPDAIRRLANKYNIEIAEIAVSPEVKAEQQQRESLVIVNQLVAEYFEQQLFETDEGRSIGLGYFKERGLREDIIRRFQLGFAPDSPQSLLQFAQTKGINPQTLEQLGIIVQKDDRQWAFFRKRVQFAIHNPQAKVVAFAGRTLSSDKKQAKYINSPETEIYHKSKVLYGIHLAKKSIAQLNECYLVEGYTDVLSLVQNGIENVVASAGTALTVEQIRLIKRYTPNITILYDGDAAGIKAALRGIDLVLEEDMNLKVVLLPEPEDPDSYIRKIGKTDFEQYLRKNAKDFVLFKTQLLLKDIGDDPIARATLVRDIVTTITLIPDSIKRQIYVQKCAQLLLIDEQILINEVNKARLKNLKQQQKNAGTEVEEDEYAKTIKAYGLPADLPREEVNCFRAYKFYCYGNELYAIRYTGGGFNIVQISNFKLESLYLIKGVKRIFKITNQDGQTETVELRVADLQSKATLSAATTDYGNFVFWGTAMDLANLQRYLFSRETMSLEIGRLGNHKDGFWAWCNGIWDYEKKTFVEVDEHGMVPVERDGVKRWYYIPASTTNEATLDDWGSLTKFRYEVSSTNFAEWAKLYYEAYGKNGMVGIAFGIMTCFRDIIMRDAGCSPMLFLFGQRGSGKSELARSLLWLFGTGQDVLSLEAGSTPKSFTRLLRQKANATLLLDEWKNHLEKMIGPVKGVWDGYMSGRAAFTNDDRTKDATLYSTAIVAGQELPNIEPALYSRFILLNFDKSKFGDEQTTKYRELKKMQARGLTGVTHEILMIRKLFDEKFLDRFIEVNNLSKAIYRQSETIDRVLRNIDILVAVTSIAEEAGMQLPFTLQEFMIYTELLIPQQTNLMSTADEVRMFFGVLPTLIKNKKISQNIDYAIVGNELRIRLGQVLGEYKKEIVSQRGNPLDEGTLSSYMRTHSAFVAHKTVKFGGRATTAYVFDYGKLNSMYDLNLELVGAEVDISDLPDEFIPSQNNRQQL